jgi:arabinofuranosyltransferase
MAGAGGSGRVVRWMLPAVPTAVLVGMGWQHRWMSDDGFIHLRVVQQLVGGNGPVFNVGERVEATTSPLWVFLLAVAEPLPAVTLPWKAVLLGIAFTGLGLVAAQAAGRTLAAPVGEDDGETGDPTADHGGTIALPVGALVIALLPPFWDFASSGLETGLTFAWIGGATWWCARRATGEGLPGRRAELAGAALAGLGWLIRPDLLVFTLAFVLVLAVALRPASWRRRLGAAAAMVALPAAYQLFRMGYFAMVVPNTALAKEAGRAQWGQGWRYVTDLTTPYWLWLPVGVLLLLLGYQTLGDWRRGATLPALARAAPAVASLVHGVYFVRAGGDFMHARLLLPALFGLLAPVTVAVPASLAQLRQALRPRPSASPANPPGGLRRIRRRAGTVLPLAGTAAVALWAVGSLALRPRPPTQIRHHIEDERILQQYAFGQEHPIDVDRNLRQSHANADVFLPAEPGRLGVLSLTLQPAQVDLRTELPVRAGAVPPALGAGAYASDLDVYMVDLGSLAHPVGSHLDHLIGSRPGHQKPLPLAWQVAGLSDDREVRTADGTVLASSEELTAARRARSCGELARYLREVREPLTLGRFLGNVARSIPNTLLRVPPDPIDAEAELCD